MHDLVDIVKKAAEKCKKKSKIRSEKSIEKEILRFLNSLRDCLAYKHHQAGINRTGDPDITGCIRGRRLEIEVKRVGEKPTLIQFERLNEWSKAGAFATWTDNLEKLKTEMVDAKIISKEEAWPSK